MNRKHDLEQDKVAAAATVALLYRTTGRAPKQFDIADELGWSFSRAGNALRALQRQGVLAHGYMIAPPSAPLGGQGGVV